MTRLLFRGSHQVALHWICGVFDDQVLKVFENRCRGFGLFWFLQWLEDVCLLESWDNDRVVFSLRTQPLSSFTLVPTARKHTLGALPGNGRFTRALKVITWRQPACCPSLIPLSSPPCCLWSFWKMGAWPLELWPPFGRRNPPGLDAFEAVICEKDTELPRVRAAVEFKRFQHQSHIVFVYVFIPPLFLFFILLLYEI